ncbi:MAG: YcxB family protein [Acidimicrobiia bacterium]|nr:YcxB family protein [Acidimicrobiia bacterium]
MSERLSVEFTATRADMRAFQRFVTARIRASVRSPLYWGVLVLFGVVVGFVLSGAAGVRLHRPTAALVVGLGAGIWLVLAWLYKQAAVPDERGSLVGPRRVELDDSGVRQVSAVHDGRTVWAGVLAVHVTPTHVFLMTDTLAGYIIPRHVFRSPSECDAFIDFARRHTGV